MTAAAGAAAAAHQGPASAGRGETAGAQAAIVIVAREPGARAILHRELSKRYGADYRIVVCAGPAELAAGMQDLRKAGLPVALVIGGVGGQDRDGIEVLSAIRRIDPGGTINVRKPLSGGLVRALSAGSGHWNSPIVTGGRLIEPTGAYGSSATSSVIDIWHLPGR